MSGLALKVGYRGTSIANGVAGDHDLQQYGMLFDRHNHRKLKHKPEVKNCIVYLSKFMLHHISKNSNLHAMTSQ